MSTTLQPPPPFATGVELIAKERARQISKEGWDDAHDDTHMDGELAVAAIAYAMTPLQRKAKREYRCIGEDDRMTTGIQTLLSFFWPWDDERWKPARNRIRDLTKAGALIAAEIDRLQRSKL